MNILLTLLLTLEIADGLLTHWAVAHGLASEWNSYVNQITGDMLFPVLKTAGGIVSVFALWAISKRFPKVGVTITSGIILFYAAVLTWNFYILSCPNLL